MAIGIATDLKSVEPHRTGRFLFKLFASDQILVQIFKPEPVRCDYVFAFKPGALHHTALFLEQLMCRYLNHILVYFIYISIFLSIIIFM